MTNDPSRPFGGLLSFDEEPTLRGARWITRGLMDFAKRDIDSLFGEGYAAANPGLVGDYMKTAMHEIASPNMSGLDDTANELSAVSETLGDVSESLARLPDRLSEAIEESGKCPIGARRCPKAAR